MDYSASNLSDKFGLFEDHWHPRIVAELNGQQVKVAKLLGEFDWHVHDNEDEMFFVHKGELVIRMEDGEVTIKEGELFVVPRGVRHQPVALQEAQVVLFEPASTINTGDQTTDRTREKLDRI